MSGNNIPDLNSSGKFVTPVSGNKVYKTRKEVVDAHLSEEIVVEPIRIPRLYTDKDFNHEC